MRTKRQNWMNNCCTRGLVLSISEHSESDKIVTFYSPDLGKAAGIAKGAKRSKKRFVNKLEEFSLLRILYTPPKRDSLHFLREAELENAFLSLRNTYPRYVAATFIGELTLRFTREHDPDPTIFELLLWAIQNLENGRAPLEICALFHLRILGAAGYQPVLDCCGVCGETIRAGQRYGLHTGGGVLVCDTCRGAIHGGSTAITVQTLKFLHHAQRAELGTLERLRLSPKNIAETLAILHKYTLHLLQHDIHSWQQIRTLLESSR
ncbi:MAG: DNA repair protein RecO [Desulfobulbaceae bacterium]|nr:DNA repair protein RecO [Desulfobulbaceae bacterium]